MKKKQAVILPLFMLAGGSWRRWYGGGFGKLGDITRFWKYLVLAAVVIFMYYVCGLLDWHNWRMYAVIASFALHWARSRGDYYYVYDTSPDEGRIWWIDWCLRKIYGEGNYYNFKEMLRDFSCAILALLFWLPLACLVLILSLPVFLRLELMRSREKWKSRRNRRSF